MSYHTGTRPKESRMRLALLYTPEVFRGERRCNIADDSWMLVGEHLSIY